MNSKKKVQGSGGLVYSTDPNFSLNSAESQSTELLEPAKQMLRVMLDKKQRAGKSVTLITGFSGHEDKLEELGKKLKTYCGTGGSVKDGEILVQGDNRQKIVDWLLKNGYSKTKKVG
jgi:translation initiation factor 1